MSPWRPSQKGKCPNWHYRIRIVEKSGNIEKSERRTAADKAVGQIAIVWAALYFTILFLPLTLHHETRFVFCCMMASTGKRRNSHEGEC